MVKRRRFVHLLRLLLVFAGMNALWYVAYLLMNHAILPSPGAVYKAMFQLGAHDVALNVGYSLMRITEGVLLALLLGLLAGLLMGRSPFWNRILDPVVYLTYPIPKIALLPVVMLFFGLGETSKVLMIMLILLFQVIISVRDGVKAIPESTYDVLTSIGASTMQKFWNVTLPGALSVILSTIRISLGTAISVLFSPKSTARSMAWASLSWMPGCGWTTLRCMPELCCSVWWDSCCSCWWMCWITDS